MATTTVSAGDYFVFLIPASAVVSKPEGDPWRPLVHTVDLEAVASSAVWGAITGSLAAQTDLSAALALLAPLASPALTGTPTAPTAAPATNTTQVATTAYVVAAVAAAPAETLAATLLAGNTTGARDVVVDGGQAVRGAAATTLSLVGPAGLSLAATTGPASLAASSGAASVTGTTSATLTGGTSAGVTATTGAMTLAASSGPASLTASSAVAVTGGSGLTATATTGTAALVATAGAANVTAGTTSTIATASGVTVSATAADTTPALTLTSSGANGASSAIHVGTRDPEGLVTANPGGFYRRNTGTVGEGFVKTSGVGNTGWQRIGNLTVFQRATTTATINGTAAETTLWSFTVPGGALGANGMLAVRLSGSFVTTALAASYTMRIKFGATTIYADNSPSIVLSATPRGWLYDLRLFNRNSTGTQGGGGSVLIGGGGTATTGTGSFGNQIAGGGPILFGACAENTANDLVFAITVQHSGASAGITTTRNTAYAAINRSV